MSVAELSNPTRLALRQFRAETTGAAGVAEAGAPGASTSRAMPAGCCWAEALPPAMITAATSLANKPCLDKSFFLVLAGASCCGRQMAVDMKHDITSQH